MFDKLYYIRIIEFVAMNRKSSTKPSNLGNKKMSTSKLNFFDYLPNEITINILEHIASQQPFGLFYCKLRYFKFHVLLTTILLIDFN